MINQSCTSVAIIQQVGMNEPHAPIDIHVHLTQNWFKWKQTKGELWDVCCEDFGEKWTRYNGTALYSKQLITLELDNAARASTGIYGNIFNFVPVSYEK